MTYAQRTPALVCLTADGYLDTSFSGDGIASFGSPGDISSITTLPNGSVVAAGQATYQNQVPPDDIQVCKLRADGTLDPNFGTGGRVLLDISGAAETLYRILVRPNGGLLVVGAIRKDGKSDCLVVALTSSGARDASFGTGGVLVVDAGSGLDDEARSAFIMPDGRILAAGVVNDYAHPAPLKFSIFRLMPNGTPDATFGSGYMMQVPGMESYCAINFAGDVAIDSSGRILVGGAFGDPAGGLLGGLLIRLKGDPDTDGDGIVDASETGTGIYVSPFNTGTNPNNRDTDGDGLSDGEEAYRYLSNPLLADTDGDGFLDGYEVLTGKSPIDPLDKPALVAEARTAIEFTFPAAVGKTYRIEASTDLVAWEIVESGIAGTGGQVQRFYSTRGQPKRYFRVEEVAP